MKILVRNTLKPNTASEDLDEIVGSMALTLENHVRAKSGPGQFVARDTPGEKISEDAPKRTNHESIHINGFVITHLLIVRNRNILL